MPQFFPFVGVGNEDALQEIVDDSPPKHSRRSALLKNLAGLWKRRQEQLNQDPDLSLKSTPSGLWQQEDYFHIRTPSLLETNATSLEDGIAPRAIPSLPRPLTFLRQESERRDKLLEVPQCATERRAVSLDRRRSLRSGTATRSLLPTPVPLPTVSAPDIVKSGDSKLKPGPPQSCNKIGTEDDEEFEIDRTSLQEEYDQRWILNLSMHFRDKSEREKFFVAYADTSNKWRRLTVSLDYRNAPSDSLEADLRGLQFQRDKSFRIYEAIRDSLPEIQFYDTVTNLKLETEDDQLHVHVREDRNEVLRDSSLPAFGDKPHRGRGQRKNDAFWSDYNDDLSKDPFDNRECLFSDSSGRVKTPAFANLDTGLKIPGGLVMSSRYAKEIGRYQDISTNFVDPCLRTVSGHLTPVIGILRDVVFRLKGTSVTFKRDFFICDAIDDMIDVMFGASFIKDQFKLLFERVKSLCSSFAGWFSTKKETAEERIERERKECEQKLRANERELARLAKESARLEALKTQSKQAATNSQ